MIRCRRCGRPILPDQESETTYAGSVSGATMVANHVHTDCQEAFESFLAGAAGARQEEAAPLPPGERP